MLKICEPEIYIEEFNQLSPESLVQFLNSLEKRRALERQLQIMIESVTDIEILVVKELHLGIPQNEENVFDLMTGYLSNPLKLKEMRAFRHILVHLYGKADNEKVYGGIIYPIIFPQTALP